MSNDETPLGGQYDPDELEELESQAERRGTGRGLVIGLLIAAADAIAAIALSAQIRAHSAATSAGTSTPTTPVAIRAPSRTGNCPAVKTQEPARTAGR